MDTTMNTMSHPEPDMDDMDVCPICGGDMENGHCDICDFSTMDYDTDDKVEMTAKTRSALPDSAFLYVSGNTRMFPVHDLKHLRLAIQMLPKAKLSPEIKARLKSKLQKLAKKHGIDMSEQQTESTSNSNNLLVETTDSKVILEKGTDNYHRAKFLITTIGQVNKNRRVYPESVIARELSLYGNPDNMRGDILGQDTHPTDTPKFTEQFLIWEKFMREGDKEYAVARVVPTKNQGENFIMLAQAGAMVSCSRRGTGSVREGTVGGQKAMIVQDDYRLVGVDILPPHTNSDHNAYMMRFESIQPNTQGNNMPESTSIEETEQDVVEQPAPESVSLDTIVENTSTSTEQAQPNVANENIATDAQETTPVPAPVSEMLTAEIQAKNALISEQTAKLTELTADNTAKTEQIKSLTESVNVLKDEIARLLGQISELNSTVESKDKSLVEGEAKIAERDTTLVKRDAEIKSLQEQLLAEKNLTEAEKERNKAFQHLFEKVQTEGEKASWYILNELRTCATVQEVDEKFAVSKAKGIQLIEGISRPAGRAILRGTTPTDADELTTETKPKDSPTALPPEVAERALRVARMGGL